MKDYQEIWKQREFRKVLIAGVIGRFGDSIDMIAYTWLVYAITGSATWTSVMFGINMLPNVLLQPFAGVFVERMNKKKVMIITDFIRCALVFITALVYLSGRMSPWFLVAFTLLMNSAECFYLPADTAFTPQVLEKSLYSFGLSLSSTLSRISSLIGMGVAGIIIAKAGVGVAFAIDGATFAVSALLISLVRAKNESDPALESKNNTDSLKGEAESYVQLLKDGLRYIKGNRVIVNFCILAVLLNAVLVPINALETPLVVEVYGMGAELLSALGVVISLGSVIGAFFTPYLMKKFSVRSIIVASGIFSGICYVGLLTGSFFKGQTIPVYVISMTSLGLICMFMCFISGVLSIQFMHHVEERYLARSNAIFNAFSTVSMPVLSFLIGGLTGFLSVHTMFLLAGISCIALFMITGIRRTDYGASERDRDTVPEAVV